MRVAGMQVDDLEPVLVGLVAEVLERVAGEIRQKEIEPRLRAVRLLRDECPGRALVVGDRGALVLQWYLERESVRDLQRLRVPLGPSAQTSLGPIRRPGAWRALARAAIGLPAAATVRD